MIFLLLPSYYIHYRLALSISDPTFDSQENSITEESEDDVFTEDQAAMDTEEDMDELEIATNDNGGYNRVLDWTTSDVVSVDNDISGVEPLEMTTDTDAKVRHWLRKELKESQYSFVHLWSKFIQSSRSLIFLSQVSYVSLSLSPLCRIDGT